MSAKRSRARKTIDARHSKALARLENKKWLAVRHRTASVREIAAELGVAPEVVLRFIFRHGLDTEHRARSGELLVPRHRLLNHQRKRLEDRAWLEALYRKRGTLAICEELGVRPEPVLNYLRAHGTEPRNRPITETSRAMLDDRDWLKAQYLAQPAWKIALELGVAPVLVGRALVRHGLKPKGYSRLPRGSRPRTKQQKKIAAMLADRDWLKDQLSKRTVKELAVMLGVDDATIDRALRKHKLARLRLANPRLWEARKKLRDRRWLEEQYGTKERSVVEIAASLGVGIGIVRAHLTKAGIRVRRSGESGKDKRIAGAKVVRQLRARGWRYEEIAKHLGVSTNTPRNWERLRG